jgi:hypothetical protein
MTVEDRIEALRARHKSLEEAIATETHRPVPDMNLVADWKRQKLRIKDEIAEIQHTH